MSGGIELDVAYVARLARLNLTDEEIAIFRAQLSDVLRHIDKIREVDVRNVEISSHATPMLNVFREDNPRDWFTTEEALRNAPRHANDLFIVTKVVE